MDFKKIFIETCEEFKANVRSKVKEYNNFRVSVEDVVKKVQNYPIHLQIFESCFKVGQIKTMRFALKVFGDGIVRINQHRDVSIVSPIFYVSIATQNLDRGDLVLPVCHLPPFSDNDTAEEQNIQIFVPSSSETENDELGEGDRISLFDLLPACQSDVLPEDRTPGYSIRTSKGDNFTSIKEGHGLLVGDFLVVRGGKSYKICDIHPDDAFTPTEGSHNLVFVEKPFENNTEKQPLRFRKMIYLRGKLISVSASSLSSFRGIAINFKDSKNKNNNHGVMELSFSRAVFNSLWYYTRNLAIAEADI